MNFNSTNLLKFICEKFIQKALLHETFETLEMLENENLIQFQESQSKIDELKLQIQSYEKEKDQFMKHLDNFQESINVSLETIGEKLDSNLVKKLKKSLED